LPCEWLDVELIQNDATGAVLMTTMTQVPGTTSTPASGMTSDEKFVIFASSLDERFQSSNHMKRSKLPQSGGGEANQQLSGFMESLV
jgi:hypothetical protein